MAGITTPALIDIANQLSHAKEHLYWREDQGRYYRAGDNLGEGYHNCNLHSLLIGPGACGYECSDFSLGIFMLGARTLYRDHRHLAPELYLNLSDRSGWRFDGGPWQDYPGGSMVWNEPLKVHATRVYESPFISVFVWLKDVHEPCEVVAMDDWKQIEEGLKAL